MLILHNLSDRFNSFCQVLKMDEAVIIAVLFFAGVRFLVAFGTPETQEEIALKRERKARKKAKALKRSNARRGSNSFAEATGRFTGSMHSSHRSSQRTGDYAFESRQYSFNSENVSSPASVAKLNRSGF